MPRNGTGTYSLPVGNPVSAGTVISETWANTTLADLATAVTQSLAADGQTVLTADLGMSNNKLTALADGTAVTHAATLGQVQKNTACVLSAVAGGTLAYTATLPYSTTALSMGQKVVFQPNATNTGAVTLTINGGTARSVLRQDGSASQAGDYTTGTPYELVWDGSAWRSMTPLVQGVYAPLASPTFTGTVTHPTPFTLGAVSVTATGTEMNYLVGVTSGIQSQLNLKAPLANPTFTGTVSGIDASMVGLGNVTNESKATMFTSPTFTGTVSGVSASMVGLGNVTNESKATMFTSPTFTGTVSGVSATAVGLGNVTNESKATMFTSPTFTGTVVIPTPFTIGAVSLTATATQINAAAVTYAPTSGTYTPTPVAGTNCSSPVQGLGQWMRIGNIVHVTCQVGITVTSTTDTTMYIPLPVSSNLSATGDLNGIGATYESSSNISAYIQGDTVNDRAFMSWRAVGTGAKTLFASFQYEVK
jgi:hypothetical protein